MAKNNARRFTTNPTILPPASGESPVPRGTSAGPETSPPGRAISPTIRRARPQDLKFLSHLQKKYSNELGFLPTAALQWYVEQQRVGVVLENNEPAGYVLGRTHYKYQPLMRPITQTAIAFDARRRHLGMALIQRVEQHARDERQMAMQAICAENLDANDFWLALGFEHVTTFGGQNTRGRALHVWRKCVTKTRPDWFTTPPPDPGQRRRKR
jgi:N-acetylglutamate synthase-like GNAT family acetyltransferase